MKLLRFLKIIWKDADDEGYTWAFGIPLFFVIETFLGKLIYQKLAGTKGDFSDWLLMGLCLTMAIIILVIVGYVLYKLIKYLIGVWGEA